MFFEDREVAYEGESPDRRWKLLIYVPGQTEEDNTYFAEFEKEGGARAIGIPFGPPESHAPVKVDWELDGKMAAIYLDDKCYALFKWGEGFIKPREHFRWGDEPPFTGEEIAVIKSQWRALY